MSPIWTALGALGLLALATLRFVWLGEWGLWIDEAHTLHDSMASSRASQSYPMGYWATRLAVALRSGDISETTLRLMPAVFGALALPLTVWAFRPLIGSRRALVAALLMGASTWHLYWSQSARAYTLALDLSLIGSALYARGVLLRQRNALPAGFGVGILAMFAHPSAAMLIPAWVGAPFVLRRMGLSVPVPQPSQRLRRMLWLAAAIGAVWAIRVVVDYEDAKGSEGQRFTFWIGSWKHFALTTGFYVTPWLGGAALLGGWLAVRRPVPEDAGRAAGPGQLVAGQLAGQLAGGQAGGFDRLAAVVLCLVVASALAMATLVRVSAQYVFVLLPWFAALATQPLVRWRGAAAGALVGLLLLPGLGLTALYFGPGYGNRPRWREAYAHVFDQRQAHDLVFGMAAVVGQYYLDPGSVSLRDQRDLVRLNSYTAHEPAQWSRRGRRTWFVVRREDLMDWPKEDRDAFKRILAEECTLSVELPVKYTPRDLSVEVYVREPFAANAPEESEESAPGQSVPGDPVDD